MEESFRIGVLQSSESVLKSPRGCFILHVGAQKKSSEVSFGSSEVLFLPYEGNAN